MGKKTKAMSVLLMSGSCLHPGAATTVKVLLLRIMNLKM